MNGRQSGFIAGQAWHTENSLQGATRMECRECYCLSSAIAGSDLLTVSMATQPKNNPSNIQSSATLVQAHSGFIV